MAAGGTSSDDVESLPSYTIVSGLPTYDEALEQLRQVNESHTDTKMVEVQAQSTQKNSANSDSRQLQSMAKLSVMEFMQFHKSSTVN
jgi:hypothetical protein